MSVRRRTMMLAFLYLRGTLGTWSYKALFGCQRPLWKTKILFMNSQRAIRPRKAKNLCRPLLLNQFKTAFLSAWTFCVYLVLFPCRQCSLRGTTVLQLLNIELKIKGNIIFFLLTLQCFQLHTPLTQLFCSPFDLIFNWGLKEEMSAIKFILHLIFCGGQFVTASFENTHYHEFYNGVFLFVPHTCCFANIMSVAI